MKIVSAPFGNYIQPEGWTPTLGTFTPQYRGGVAKRIVRCLKTLRWDFRNKGWVNRLGLPNPGIEYIHERKEIVKGKILSIGCASDDQNRDFIHMLALCQRMDPLYFELNISCPNEERGVPTDMMLHIVKDSLPANRTILKLPPDEDYLRNNLDDWLKMGFTMFHLCNTIATDRGGLSGVSLIPIVTRMLLETRKNYGPIPTLIAGGGIVSPRVAEEYMFSGADHVAVGSAWLNRLNWGNLKKITDRRKLKR